MKKSTFVFLVLCDIAIFFFVKAILTPVQTASNYAKPLLTPTINYYQEDLYAQCRGLESAKKLIENYPSLEINENFNKDYHRILTTIDRDTKILGLDGFKCP
jgi:hypothetical protein